MRNDQKQDMRSDAIKYAQTHEADTLENFRALLAIPSVSTDPEHNADMQRAAEWLANYLNKKNIRAQVFSTQGHPIVYGENLSAGPDAPTLLVYGHYDVQPPDPLELWKTSPFDPTVRDGYLYARGASDMKGQVIDSISAVDAVLNQPNPPLNFKFIIEGEEEIGSPHLASFLEEHKKLLASDIALNPDSGMIDPKTPAITYSLRGLAHFELRVYGPARDLHSGSFGGVVHNPAQALCELVAGMHDKEGRITLPGYYDSVRPLSIDERAQLQRLPTNEDFYLKQTGSPGLYGEPEFTPVERIGGRPTLEVHGLLSGFTGAGTKTVIPSWAMAKISSRLTPNQKADEVHQQMRRYLEEHAPKSIRWELTYMGGGPAVMTDPNLPATRALAKGLETIWGTPPVLIREGGSIPVVVEMQEILHLPSVVTGFGLPDDNIHSPNERLNLANWLRGRDALIHFFYNLAELETLQ